MHGVVVIPATAPDEAVFLEKGNEGHRNPVSIVNEAACAILLPVPIVGIADINIDSRSERMHAEMISARYEAPVKPATGFVAEATNLGWHRIETIRDCREAAVNAKDLRNPDHPLAELWQPPYADDMLSYRLGAGTLKLLEEWLVTDATGIEINGWSEGASAHWIDIVKHIFDVRPFVQLGSTALLAIIPDHRGAVVPSQRVGRDGEKPGVSLKHCSFGCGLIYAITRLRGSSTKQYHRTYGS